MHGIASPVATDEEMVIPRVLVTGASGFIGTHALPVLRDSAVRVRLLTRRPVEAPPDVEVHVVQELDERSIEPAFADVQVVCHLAGRAHVVDRRQQDQSDYDAVNVDTSVRLAGAAFRRGVTRMVFVSSIGAVASASRPGEPLDEAAPCQPTTPYGRSKLKAERALREEADRHGAQLVVIRPPLVHGPGAPGNLSILRRLVEAGAPLPLGGVDNLRSLIHVRNLARILAAAAMVPEAAGHTFHVRDAQDYSTPQIVAAAAKSAGRSGRTFTAPLQVLRAAATLSGRRGAFDQLTGWLQVDDRRARKVLGVVPLPLPLEIGTQGQ